MKRPSLLTILGWGLPLAAAVVLALSTKPPEKWVFSEPRPDLVTADWVYERTKDHWAGPSEYWALASAANDITFYFLAVVCFENQIDVRFRIHRFTRGPIGEVDQFARVTFQVDENEPVNGKLLINGDGRQGRIVDGLNKLIPSLVRGDRFQIKVDRSDGRQIDVEFSTKRAVPTIKRVYQECGKEFPDWLRDSFDGR